MSGHGGERDVAAVIDVAQAYYDGMISADAAKLAGAFHLRASIVGNWTARCRGRHSRSSWPSVRRRSTRPGDASSGSSGCRFRATRRW